MSFNPHTARLWPGPPPPMAAAATIALILATGVLVFAGCGDGRQRAPVFKTTGRVTFGEQPAAGAFVVLHPKGTARHDAPWPTAHVQADGTFAATTFDTADGAPAGEYVVTVQWRKLVRQGGEWTPGPSLIPARYGDPTTSKLTIRIAEGENHLPPIVLR